MNKLKVFCIMGFVLAFFTISITACEKGSSSETLSTIVTNPPATPANVIDLKKYILTETEPDPDGAELLSVTLGGNDEMIGVNYTSPPQLAQRWIQGDVFVVNEANNRVYRDTVLMPVVGWLFQRPAQYGQIASVMLINNGLKKGDQLTVVLGKYRRQHIIIGDQQIQDGEEQNNDTASGTTEDAK
jgi:hypothetical protein